MNTQTDMSVRIEMLKELGFTEEQLIKSGRYKSFEDAKNAKIVITPGARAVLSDNRIKRILDNHFNRKWNHLCEHDLEYNTKAADNHGTVIVDYVINPSLPASSSNRVFIQTESDRSLTTIHLFSER